MSSASDGSSHGHKTPSSKTSMKSSSLRRFSVPKGSKFTMYGHFEFSFHLPSKRKEPSSSADNEKRNGNSTVSPFICHNLPIRLNHVYFISNAHKTLFQDTDCIHLKDNYILKVRQVAHEWNIQLVSRASTKQKHRNLLHNQSSDFTSSALIQDYLRISRSSLDRIYKVSSSVGKKLDEATRLLIVGDEMCRKTLLCRYYVNKMIRKHGRAIIVQTNPENSQFHVPGMLSLIQMRDCIFDGFLLPSGDSDKTTSPSYGVERRFDVCYGHTSAEEDLDSYIQCIGQLVKKLEEWLSEESDDEESETSDSSSSSSDNSAMDSEESDATESDSDSDSIHIPIVIDTMSFSDAVQHELVCEFPNIFFPTDILICYRSEIKKKRFIAHLQEEKSDSILEENEVSSSETLSTTSSSPSPRIHELLMDEDKSVVIYNKRLQSHQQTALLSYYFGCCGPQRTLSCGSPRFKCHWSLFALRLHGIFQRMDSSMAWRSVMHVFNGSLVALYSSRNHHIKTRIAANKGQSCPLFIVGDERSDQQEETFEGLALISHIDMQKQCFHLVCPPSLTCNSTKTLQHINIIQYCSITLPDAMTANDQPIFSNPYRTKQRIYSQGKNLGYLFHAFHDENEIYREEDSHT